MSQSAPGSFSVSASKSSRDRMKFTANWGEGEVFDWYRKLPKSSVIVTRLQIRIEGSKPPHRFVLAYLQDGSICRFDRRPVTGKPGPLILETIFSKSARRAADERVTLKDGVLERLESTTYCEVDLIMPFGVDLLLILSACFAISKDEEAQNYNLLSYNCYFFSWTIVMVVIRHALHLVVPPAHNVSTRLAPAIKELSGTLADKFVRTLLTIVLDTVVAFRVETGRSLNKGLGKRELLVWGLPIRAVRFLLRLCFSVRLQMRLEEELNKRICERLTIHMAHLLEDVLNTKNMIEEKLQMEQHLWVNELTDAVRPLVEGQLIHVLWDAILGALGTGYGDLNHANFLQALKNSPSFLWRCKFYLMGNKMIQFTRLWNEALHAALRAARNTGDGKVQLSKLFSKEAMHSEMFDTAFKAGRDEALKAAQRVVDETGPAIGNPKRDAMWEIVWSVWDKAWDIGLEQGRKTAIGLVGKAVDQIVLLVAQNVVAAVGDNQDQHLQAVISHQFQKIPRAQEKLLSLHEFQLGIIQSVQSAYPNTNKEYLKDIQDAMTRIWHESRVSYRPLDEV